jgi:hydrogenase expression/formation protein HypE
LGGGNFINMKPGKLNWDDLKQIIESNKDTLRDDVRVHSGVGEDCSVIDFGEYECVISTDPITGADKNIGKLAVHINCNDIASCGVAPMGILVTILAPENTTLEEIKAVMDEIRQEAKSLNVEILGGHTEVTAAVNKLIVSCTVIGKSEKGKAVTSSGAEVGDDIVVTKSLALEGTSILVNDYEERIKGYLDSEEIGEAERYANLLSVVSEGLLAGEFGVHAMHDITEGGVLGALWEMAEASSVGFRVYEEKMPVTSVTRKVCSIFNVDPLGLISSGSMLITVNDGEALVNKLKSNGIEGTVVGNITKESGIIVRSGQEVEVRPPERDELFRI